MWVPRRLRRRRVRITIRDTMSQPPPRPAGSRPAPAGPACAALLLVAVLGALVRLLPATGAVGAGLKIVVPALVLGFLPGMVLVIGLRPVPRLTALEWAGIGFALSLG